MRDGETMHDESGIEANSVNPADSENGGFSSVELNGSDSESERNLADEEKQQTPPPLPRAPEKSEQSKPTQPVNQIRRITASIGIGLPRNKYRIFIGKGAIPPVSEAKQFVAPLADINKVRIKILEGDDDIADRNLYLGEIGINNIKLRDDGKSEIEIDFSLNAMGILTVRLRDRIGHTEGVARFVPFQFRRELKSTPDLSRIPVEELNQKISLLEEQMFSLKKELEVRREG